jgi:hypothetical protein
MMRTGLRLLFVLIAVGGGCTGVLETTQLFSGLPNLGFRYAVIVFISFALYAFLTAAGLLFVYDANLTRPMLCAFALQIPWVDLPGIKYQVFSLLYAAITLGPPQGNGRIGTYVGWSANIGTQGQFRIGGLPAADWSVGVNLFALLITMVLLKFGGTTDATAILESESQIPES